MAEEKEKAIEKNHEPIIPDGSHKDQLSDEE